MKHEPKVDKLAERIAARRAEMTKTGEPAHTDSVAFPAAPESHVADTPPQLDSIIVLKLGEARAAITAAVNPLKVARLLSEIVALGMVQKNLAAALGVSKSWLSKRLSLLAAPAQVQQLIESGGLSESEYHNNKNASSQIKSRAGTLEYQRMPTITINIEAARSLAAILQTLAEKHSGSPISFGSGASKKDITSILTYRAGDILELIK